MTQIDDSQLETARHAPYGISRRSAFGGVRHSAPSPASAVSPSSYSLEWRDA